MNPKRNPLYNATVVCVGNNKFRVSSVRRLMGLNQFKRRWKRVSARKFTRSLNRGVVTVN